MPHGPDPSSLGVSSSQGHRWLINKSLETPGSSPLTIQIGTPSLQRGRALPGVTQKVWCHGRLCPAASGEPRAFTPASSPPPPRLTLQLRVPSLPLKADGGCPIMDEALEAGILALPHGAAGRVDRDDRAPKAWGRTEAEGCAQQGWVGSPASPPHSSAPVSPRLPLPVASPSLTVGGPCTGRDSDREGGLVLRARAANHTAYVFSGVGLGDVVEPQPGAVGLSE